MKNCENQCLLLEKMEVNILSIHGSFEFTVEVEMLAREKFLFNLHFTKMCKYNPVQKVFNPCA